MNESPDRLSQTDSLRTREWRRFVRGPDQSLLDDLYIPALGASARYDRCCAYFSSSVLAAAARGFARLIERLVAAGPSAPRPSVRLVVNEELSEDDVRAMTETGDLAALEKHLLSHLKSPKELLEKQRLGMLGWLVKEGLLEVRVGVMRHGEGIVHAKFGIATDPAGDAIVFSGSGNESAAGLRANYEEIEVSSSWGDAERFRYYRDRFDALWTNRDPDVLTVTLPEALRLKLVKFAPKEPPVTEPSNALARQRAAMLWRFIVEAPYFEGGETACDATAMVDLWPHQRRVVEDAAAAWPDGRLLCDEVGMGKTIEAVVALRRLLAGRGVRRVLVLLPAGLLIQWQEELREKGGLVFPRFDPFKGLLWPDGREQRMAGLAEALACDRLLLSRETARTEANQRFLLEAEPWDLVLLDEAHAARRESRVETEYNTATLLLELLRQLQLQRKARGFFLLSATPMQTHPWEPWDLLAVLGEGAPWLSEFATVREFYRAAAAIERGACQLPTARAAARTITLDPEFPPPPDGAGHRRDTDGIARAIAFATAARREMIARWLRRGSPLARRMHRNTRATLRRYFQMGVLDRPPAERQIKDEVFDFADAAERRVYDSITGYIERRFAELEREKPGKGFVMTIYRRRAASSPHALEQSLKRRRDGLRRVVAQQAPDVFADAELDPRDRDDLGDFDPSGRVSAALPTDPQVAARELAEVEQLLEQLSELRGRDSKRDRFFDVLRRITDDGRAVLVFTEYSDTMDYLRESLAAHYGRTLGCYSGDGGKHWNGNQWDNVTKDAITTMLHAGGLNVLVCTDAASEGLNLQAAGAIINYDLPWNPSKVEQRIGRIDRIGQRHAEVRIVNFFLARSVDEQVYVTLRQRCGLFEHFVGRMQPVLAVARRVLLGQGGDTLDSIRRAADEVDSDPLAAESYVESDAELSNPAPAMLGRAALRDALGALDGAFGVTAKDVDDQCFRVSGVKAKLALSEEALERDEKTVSLSPLADEAREIAEMLGRPGERLPLVVASAQDGAFRASAAVWIGANGAETLTSYGDLKQKAMTWDGVYPEPGVWLEAEADTKRAAERRVATMKRQATERETRALDRQVEAARLRLLRELGRYLVSLGHGTGDLNGVLYRQLQREDIASRDRLERALKLLGGQYPEWPDHLIEELNAFDRTADANQRRGRLIGKEIDAAIADPRWSAAHATR